MPTVTFTLASLPSSTAKRLRFEPRDAPWVNTSGAVVTPDGFESSYPRGAAQSITLDTGPWRVRIGLSWYPFDVPAAGGDLKDLILFGVPASAPASTITAAVNAYLAAHPVTAEVSDEAVAALVATDGDTRDGVDARVRAVGDATYAPATGIAKTALASGVQTSLGAADTAVQPAALTAEATARSSGDAALIAQLAANPDQIAVGTITRSTSGAVTGFTVAWPDGATGTFVGTESTTAPGAIDSYTVTHVLSGVTKTYTQPSLTRDSSGAVTARPAIVVS